jgi:hypothetical protein
MCQEEGPGRPGGNKIKWHKSTFGTSIILIDAIKEAGLDVNIKKSKYLLLSRHPNERQDCDMKIANRLLEMWHS